VGQKILKFKLIVSYIYICAIYISIHIYIYVYLYKSVCLLIFAHFDICSYIYISVPCREELVM